MHIERGPTSAYLALAAAIVLWASAFAGIRASLIAYSPAELASLRFVVASVALAALALTGRVRAPARRDVAAMVLLGVVGITIYHLALNAGARTVSAGGASLVVNTVPVITALIAAAVLGERLTPAGWIGVGIGLAGASVIAVAESGGLHIGPGALLVLLAAVSQSIYFVMQKSHLDRYRPLELTSYAIWFGTVPLIPFLPSALSTARLAPAAQTAAVVYLGIFPGAVSYFAYAYALERLPVSRASSFLFLVPVAAIPIAWLWLGEVPPPLALIGGAFCLTGVAVVNGRRASAGATRPTSREVRRVSGPIEDLR